MRAPASGASPSFDLVAWRARLVDIHLQVKLLRLQRFLRKYRPDQPRVPAGSPGGGQWTAEGGAIGGSSGSDVLLGGGGDDELPGIPKDRPASSAERTRIKKEVSRRFGPLDGLLTNLRLIFAVAEWLTESTADIITYSDGPRTLEDLQDLVREPRRGYEIHHIVEQTPARRDGIPDALIDSPENLVRIPTLKHYEITGWFLKPNDLYVGMTPREYLRKKSFGFRYEVGLQALRVHGILRD